MKAIYFTEKRENQIKKIGLVFILLIAFFMVLYFGKQKSGFHEDEYYTYYSSNYTHGWNVPDGQWVEMEEYQQEFMVLPNEKFQYGLVKLVQSWDVHPPMYYWIIHTVCSISPNFFSKWQGLMINIVSYLISILLIYACIDKRYRASKHWYAGLIGCMLFAFSPAIVSSVMFIRMYAFLSLCILMSLVLHINAFETGQLLKIKYFIPIMLIVYIGFLTHYYFMIFQFFLTASICVTLFFWEKEYKQAILYGTYILASIILGIISFPACLGQMFHGQRGAEATSNFFNIKNTFDRFVYFIKLADKFWFGYFGICILLLLVVCFFIKKKSNTSKDTLDYLNIILGITCIGYFITVSKTALMLGDSSVRYVLPIFGPIIILVARIMANVNIYGNEQKPFIRSVLMAFFIAIGINVIGIASGKVLFLFPEDQAKVEFANAHKNDKVIYIYDTNNSWKIWESTDELLEYKNVFFISDSSTQNIKDYFEGDVEDMIVYIAKNEKQQEQLNNVISIFDGQINCELLFDEKFCDLYYLSK